MISINISPHRMSIPLNGTSHCQIHKGEMDNSNIGFIWFSAICKSAFQLTESFSTEEGRMLISEMVDQVRDFH